MIPLYALLKRRTFPSITFLLIVLNGFFFLYRLDLGAYTQQGFIAGYGLAPDHFHVQMLVTSIFVHSGWFHLLLNMWFLWVFGSLVEEAMGPGLYAVFFLAAGVAAAAVHFIANSGSPVVAMGTSGAIAAVMGAFLMIYPKEKIVTLVLLVLFITTFDFPVAYLMGYWFVIELVGGLILFHGTAVCDAGHLSWIAIIAAFLLGAMLTRLLRVEPLKRSVTSWKM